MSAIPDGRFMRYLVEPFLRLWTYRVILAKTTWAELSGVYAGSVLGISWLVIGQVALLALYTITYLFIFKVRPEVLTVHQYILYVFAGLVPFISFSASLTSGATSLSKDRQILLNTVFPAELLPVRSILIATAPLPIGLGLVVIGDVTFGAATPTLLLVPVVVVFQIMFQSGIAWILALVTLVVRDIQYALQYVTMMFLIITPIGYTPEMIPRSLAVLMYGNPLFYFASSYQSLIVYNKLPDPSVVLIGGVGSVLMFVAGFFIFQRAKLTFFDYV